MDYGNLLLFFWKYKAVFFVGLFFCVLPGLFKVLMKVLSADE